ncbi:HesA/MoeB/ThiF family protein [Actinoplanes sp. NPDC051859]|uniref:HesA/MoeB/ThiF family protein n=1 Tax=Actinoplanes sp. NPDC051859 TaxID=3363909 RepID=UPI003791CACB
MRGQADTAATTGTSRTPARGPRPRLKAVVWERTGDELRVVYDRREQLIIDDEAGVVEALLELLHAGGRTVAELADALTAAGRPVGADDVAEAVAAFDAHGLLEDGDRLGRLAPEDAERHFSSLSFFQSFASLSRSREDFQESLRNAHVLVLGTGGFNSNLLPHLCGLGVGRLTLLDRDAVEPRNFARQYLYRWSEIGQRKVARAVEWVRAFDPSIDVRGIDAGIEGPEQLADLLDEVRPDVVADGIDHPGEVDSWVNAACVSRGVPFVRGGMWVTEGLVWSVDPGRSACLQCASLPDPDAADLDAATATALAGLTLHDVRQPRTNRGIGPVAGLLGALGAFEVLRYLTAFEPPAYAGSSLVIDFAAGCAMRQQSWPRDPACTVCGPTALGAGSGVHRDAVAAPIGGGR